MLARLAVLAVFGLPRSARSGGGGLGPTVTPRHSARQPSGNVRRDGPRWPLAGLAGPYREILLSMATPRASSAGAGDPAAGSPDQTMSHGTSLPAALSAALAAFRRHLDAERALSRHTVRAYHGDVQSLLEYASRQGIADPAEITVNALRGWLAGQHQAGAARATIARRGAAARAFTAFAFRQGWLAADPGPQLRDTEGAPDAAPCAGPLRDGVRAGRLRGPGAARARVRPARRGGAGDAGRRRARAALRVGDPASASFAT